MDPFLSMHASTVSVQGSPRLHFEPLKLLNIEFNRDPDLAFHSSADPDPKNPDPDLVNVPYL